MIDEIDPDAPWEPEALRLAVGDRVRVQIRAECPLLGDPGMWHFTPAADGQQGRVMKTWPRALDEYFPGHCYFVALEYDGGLHGCWLARAELERLPLSSDLHGLEWRL